MSKSITPTVICAQSARVEQTKALYPKYPHLALLHTITVWQQWRNCCCGEEIWKCFLSETEILKIYIPVILQGHPNAQC
jgi:hypothetical protein